MDSPFCWVSCTQTGRCDGVGLLWANQSTGRGFTYPTSLDKGQPWNVTSQAIVEADVVRIGPGAEAAAWRPDILIGRFDRNLSARPR